MAPFMPPLGEAHSSLPSKRSAQSSLFNIYIRTRIKLFRECKQTVETTPWPEMDSPCQSRHYLSVFDKFDNVNADLIKDLEPLSDMNNEEGLEKINNGILIRTLQGNSNYNTWAAEIKHVLRRMGAVYILRNHFMPHTLKQRHDNWVACNLILQSISATQAERLCHLTADESKMAWLIWKGLRPSCSPYPSCPCNNLLGVGRGPIRLLECQEIAEDGCASCQLILDAIEAYVPTWTEVSKEGKSISVMIVRQSVRVSLGQDSGLEPSSLPSSFEFIPPPGK